MLPQPPRLGALATALLVAASPFTAAYKLDPNSTDSIKKISKDMAENMLSFYHGDEPNAPEVGVLPQPYYWWEAGAMFGALVDYWYYTKDDSYVNLTRDGLLAQTGQKDDYMPLSQRLTEGNDDQGFWGLAVMSAAENNFPNPDEGRPQWLALAQAVFNTQAARWDPDHCGGGLRWQIFKWNNGYNYKNSISQACFFALGARLALFTDNSTYADWAEKTWDWMDSVDFIDENYYVFDGADIEENCTDIVPYQFTYNAGGMILGAAAMYNYTESDVWKDRLDKLLKATDVFFGGPDKDIMYEVACETVDRCNLDEQSFKAYLSRWLAATTQWAPHTTNQIIPLLQSSAVAAAAQCVGGSNGDMCGLVWTTGKYDGTTGVGQQMAAMEVTLSCMIQERAAPVTASNGGTSKGDPSAGGDDIGRNTPAPRMWPTVPAGSKAAAAIITAVLIGVFVGGIVWLMLDETSDKTPLQQLKGFHKSSAASASSASAAIAAFAAGGGIAALRQRKKKGREGEVVNEKAGAVAGSASERSSSPSGSNDRAVVEDAPIKVGHVRHESTGHQRRISNMPLGWPHNSTVRNSVLVDSDNGRPVSTEEPFSDARSHTTEESQRRTSEYRDPNTTEHRRQSQV